MCTCVVMDVYLWKPEDSNTLWSSQQVVVSCMM